MYLASYNITTVQYSQISLDKSLFTLETTMPDTTLINPIAVGIKCLLNASNNRTIWSKEIALGISPHNFGCNISFNEMNRIIVNQISLYANEQIFMSKSMKLTVCPPGMHVNADDIDQCVNCLRGMVSQYSSTSKSCITCESGTYANSNHTLCVKCPPGFTSKAGSQDNCTRICRRGWYSNSLTNACLICENGTYANSNHTLCIQCTPGYISNAGTQGSCTQLCRSGSYSNSLNTACETCGQNEVSFGGTDFCYHCPNGTNAVDNHSTCVKTIVHQCGHFGAIFKLDRFIFGLVLGLSVAALVFLVFSMLVSFLLICNYQHSRSLKVVNKKIQSLQKTFSKDILIEIKNDEDFTLLERIGSGAVGDVFRAELFGSVCAAKSMQNKCNNEITELMKVSEPF